MQKRSLVFIPTQLHNKEKLKQAYEDVIEKEKQFKTLINNSLNKIFKPHIY